MAAQLIMPIAPGGQQQSRHFLPSAPLHQHHHHHHHNHYSRSYSYNNALTSPEATRSPHFSPTDLSAAHHHQPQPQPQHFASSPPSPRGGASSRPNRTSLYQGSDSDNNNNNNNNHHHYAYTRPLYMPAVLRPNYEFSPRHPPLSRSPAASSESGSDTGLHRRTPTANLLSLAGLGVISHRLSRRSNTNESAKSLEGDWDLTTYPHVTSLPTRQHWKPDTESSICDDPLCKRSFNYFNRRHHCRKCGNIFCDWHSSSLLPLDQDANFNPRASPSRTCNHCFEQVKARHSRRSSQSSGSADGSASRAGQDASGGGSDSRGAAVPVAAKSPTNEFNLPTSKDIAASVPRDWNWSTF